MFLIVLVVQLVQTLSQLKLNLVLAHTGAKLKCNYNSNLTMSVLIASIARLSVLHPVCDGL